ncbi:MULTISPECIES: effector-associated domain 2-containing protein [unclassified Streptomyces]|uniref:VMAP-C domain-containing protein n=1 Tax=unclassified Streptomyces TaxID=2593676 RepID=UPI003426B291
MTDSQGAWGPPKILVDALDAISCFEDPAMLHECARHVGRALRIRITLPNTGRRRNALVFLLREVAPCPDGLQALGIVISALEGETRPMARLRAAIAIAEVPLFEKPSSWERLMILLSGLDVLDIAGVFREAIGDRHDPLPAHYQEPWSAVLYAANLNARPGGPPPCVLLVERLAQYARGRQRQELLEWVAEHRKHPEAYPGGAAESDGPSPVASGGRDPLHVRPPQEFNRPASDVPLPGNGKDAVWAPSTWLLIRLRPLFYSEHEGRQQLTYWWQNGINPSPYPVKGGDLEVDEADLPERVKSLVHEAETGWAYLCREEIALEFVLSRDLMHLDVENWAKKAFGKAEATLGKDHPVVLRSLERVEGKATHGRWAKRFDALKPGCQGPVHWFPEEHPGRLLAEPHPVMAVLSEPPGRQGGVGSGAAELDASLRAGVPIVVWDRRGGIDPDFRRELLELTAKGIHRLPDEVRSLRIAAGSEDPTVGRASRLGRHAAVLWDDPYRLPGGWGEAAESSAQGGG